jgi:septum formation protein
MYNASMPAPLLILASRSPRRRQLLAAAGYTFRVVAPDDDVERGICSECSPAELVAQSAYRKAAAVSWQLVNPVLSWSPDHDSPVTAGLRDHCAGSGDPRTTGEIVLAADTVVECDGEILGKPLDKDDARAMLQRLSGRPHRVLTGVCLWPLTLPLPLGEGRGEGSTEHGRLNVARAQGESDLLLPIVRVAITRLQMDELTDQQLDDYLAGGQWEGKAGAFGYQDGLDWVHVVEGSESNVVGLPMDLLAEMLAEIGATSAE